MLVKRSKLLMFILFYALGGWYGLYWITKVQNETNAELVSCGICKKGLDKLSGGLVLLFSVLSLGLFAIVWQFYLCRKIVRLGGKRKYIPVAIMTIFVIGIIFNPLVMQGELNNIYDKNYTTLTSKLNNGGFIS